LLPSPDLCRSLVFEATSLPSNRDGSPSPLPTGPSSYIAFRQSRQFFFLTSTSPHLPLYGSMSSFPGLPFGFFKILLPAKGQTALRTSRGPFPSHPSVTSRSVPEIDPTMQVHVRLWPQSSPKSSLQTSHGMRRNSPCWARLDPPPSVVSSFWPKFAQKYVFCRPS